MLVELKTLKPNPMRDFTVDPMDDGVIEQLKQSIKEDGFWGGVICRRIDDGTLQIAAGHHRVKAALALGVRSADLFVGHDDIDDAAMIRIYARENATQRGNSGTAQAGSVASAVRWIAKRILTETSEEFFRSRDVASLRGQLLSATGIGRDVIVAFLKGVPNINNSTAQQALSNLKSSDNYARIIREVQEEIEHENREAEKAFARAERERIAAERLEREAADARKAAAIAHKTATLEADLKRAEEARQRTEAMEKLALKRRKEAEADMKKFDAMRTTLGAASATASKAADSASKKKATFDYDGVKNHLKVAHHLDVFRDTVTGPGIAPYLPKENQAKLAAEIVRLNATNKNKGGAPKELTGDFIRANVVNLVMTAKAEARDTSEKERARILRENIRMQADGHQQEFINRVSMLEGTGRKILRLQEQWPNDVAFPVTDQFRRAVKRAKDIIDQLSERT